MVKKTVDFDQIVDPEALATRIANMWTEYNSYRAKWIEQKKELRNFLFATDTTTTSNNKLGWTHTTTMPKLTQIRDNLHASYFYTLFPNRDWLKWEANTRDDAGKLKERSIKGYVNTKMRRSGFIQEASKLLNDMIDTGNMFALVSHETQFYKTLDGETITNYVGPTLNRISPYDIVFDPTASSFKNSPKIIRKLVSFGQIKKRMKEGDPLFAEMFNKIVSNRKKVLALSSTDIHKSDGYVADGFSNIQSYYQSNMVEILTFYGDMYDIDTDTLHENVIITVADRTVIIGNEPNPKWNGSDGIHHYGWRERPDNLWAMGPLDNLVGLQYRIDHLENMRATIFDQIGLGMMKIRGDVEDFVPGPLTKIYLGDEGDVTFLVPDSTVLNADFQISALEQRMEEMAGMPKQAMGFRTPGEKTAFEVSSLMTSGNRIFEHKSGSMERDFFEPIANDFLEEGRRNLNDSDIIRVIDKATGASIFKTITKEDIVGAGSIKPVGARHFAERANRIQHLAQLQQVSQDPRVSPHISGLKIAEIMAEELGEMELFGENITLIEANNSAKFNEDLQVQTEEENMIKAEEGL